MSLCRLIKDRAKLEKIKKRINSHKKEVNKEDSNKWYPIHYAAASGQTEVIALLLAAPKPYSAKIDSYTHDLWTPLHLAAFHNHGAALQLLIQNIVSAAIPTWINYPNNRKNNFTPLHCAAQTNSSEAINVLLTAGAKAEAITEDGFTALHIAITNKKYEAAYTLLDHKDNKANIEAKTSNGLTPLYLAIEAQDSRIVAALLQRSASIQHGDALHFAASSKKESTELIAIIKLLLNDINVNAPKGVATPLATAMQSKNTEVAMLLAQKGGRVFKGGKLSEDVEHIETTTYIRNQIKKTLQNYPLVELPSVPTTIPLPYPKIPSPKIPISMHFPTSPKATSTETVSVNRSTPAPSS
jgi:ankyrin repeat protein